MAETAAKLRTFFNYVFEGGEGYVCISALKRNTRTFEQLFFAWPEQQDAMIEDIERLSPYNNMYYCPNLFGERRCKKEASLACPTAWADLDTCPPDKMLVVPSLVVETSPRKYQALWRFVEPVLPTDAEDVSRRIAYYHHDDGADKTGWDLTQRLRIPFTYNYKEEYGTPKLIQVRRAGKEKYSLDAFSAYPQAEGHAYVEIPFPEKLPNRSASEILDYHKAKISGRAWTLFNEVPGPDQKEGWSGALWNLNMLLLEAGLSREETYIVASEAKCNKYARDRRSHLLLWREICRAWDRSQKNILGGEAPEADPRPLPLLTEAERQWVKDNPSIVEEYVEWAKKLGDAAWQYHQAGAFITLSTLLAGSVRLPTSFGNVIPNLWFMILADTTLTRKTTAMDIAMDLVMEVDPDCVLATDGSIEGLMTSLSMRPGRPSVFLRDEFSGLLEVMAHKDYMAGMAESFTKLYDGKFQRRVLRKETIEIRSPVLIIFGGGIRSRIMELLTYEQVASGFIPRFVFITAESDVTKLRPLGPPTEKSVGERQVILDKLHALYKHYNQETSITVEGKAIVSKKFWDAELTPEAWARYNRIESAMLESGLRMQMADIMTPTFDRLAKSGLKASVLLAASRQTGDKVIVEEGDIIRAFSYVEQWRDHSLEVVRSVGKTAGERALERIYKAIKHKPGVSRSTLMQHYRLTAKDAEAIFTTLEQRGVIERRRTGKHEALHPVVQDLEEVSA